VIGGRAVVNLSSIKPSGVRTTRQQSLKLSGRTRCDVRSGRCKR
jgi:hypothetical protein